MKNPLFDTNKYQEIEQQIKNFLNSQKDFLSHRTIASTRAVGDAIQDILADNLKNILGDGIKDYVSKFPRRAMADLAFTSKDNFYHIVDVKTHRLDTKFNMPNLTSVERLSRFYKEDKNYFIVLIIAYNVDNTHIKVNNVHFVPIEFLSWDCLTLGALGWGQIQIANSKNIIIQQQDRRKWMLELCDNLFEFYSLEIEKIGKRVKYFRNIKAFWQDKK
jgi:hypothetical protein